MPAIPTTPQQRLIMNQISGFIGKTFLRNRIRIEDGWRMLATILTWMAVEAGLTAEEYGQSLKAMHEQIARQRKG